MKIRTAHPSDLPRLTGLWLEFMGYHRRLDPDYELAEGAQDRWGDYAMSKFEDKYAQLFVAVDQDEVVAYAGAVVRDFPPVYTLKKYGLIEEIFVCADYRRKGIARQLFEAAEKWLLSNNVERIEVSIDFGNDASQGFFRDLGFRDHVVRLSRTY